MKSNRNSSGAARNSTAPGFSRLLLVVALFLTGVAAVRAQQPGYPAYPAPAYQAPPAPPPASLLPGIEVLATTYVWFPWTGVDVRPANTRFSSASTTIGPGELYGHLTWVP